MDKDKKNTMLNYTIPTFGKDRSRSRYSVTITRTKAKLDGKTYLMPLDVNLLNKLICDIMLKQDSSGGSFSLMFHKHTGVLSVRRLAHNKIVAVFSMPYFQGNIDPGRSDGEFTLGSGEYKYLARAL